MKVAAVFYPDNPCPPRWGNHYRFLQFVASLVELGYEPVVFTSVVWAQNAWTASSVDALKRMGVSDVRFTWGSERDQAFIRGRKAVYNRAWYRWLLGRPRFPASIYAPPLARKGFNRELEALAPDLISMTFTLHDGLLDHQRFRKVRRIVETQDLVSLNHSMTDAFREALGPLPITSWESVPERVLDVGFFSKLKKSADAEEFRIMDRYDTTIAICHAEAEVIRQRTCRTRVVRIPVTMPVSDSKSSCTGIPVFPMGPNVFNIHAYLLFCRHVMSRIRCIAPEFTIQVTSELARQLPAEEGVERLGYVEDLELLYRSAPFMVSPVMGGTGQQIKVVEAMARGIPVIGWKARITDSPMVDGVTGFLVSDQDSFSDCCVRLWRDRDLCRRMGRAAREAVRENCGPDVMLKGLVQCLT